MDGDIKISYIYWSTNSSSESNKHLFTAFVSFSRSTGDSPDVDSVKYTTTKAD